MVKIDTDVHQPASLAKLEHLLQTTPHDSELNFQKAVCLEKLGQHAAAEIAARAALEIDPLHQECKRLFHAIRMKQRQANTDARKNRNLSSTSLFRVLLVSPKSYEEQFEQKLRPFNFFPYSIVYLVNYLKKLQICDVDYVDLVVEPRAKLFERISNEHFDLIGLTSTTEARFANIEIIRTIRSLSPSSKIVTGGHFFSATVAEALERVAEIDFVVRGEGEITLAELVSALSSGDKRLHEIDGLAFRENGKIVLNRPRKPEMDLTKFEIDYSLIQKPGYAFRVPLKNWEEDPSKKAFPIMLGRGCDNQCIFCIHRYLPYRRAKLDSALRQIDWGVQSLGTKCFMFTDPSFCENVDFVQELCTSLIERNYPIQWYCEGRPDIPLPMLELMHQAGCISIDFALESGSARILQTIRKKTNPSAILDFAHACHQLGIRATYFTMISLPEEKVEDFIQTLEFIGHLSKWGFTTSISPMIILPGTRLEALAREKGIIAPDFSWYDDSFRCKYSFITPREIRMPHYIEHLTEREICQLRDQGNRIQNSGKEISRARHAKPQTNDHKSSVLDTSEIRHQALLSLQNGRINDAINAYTLLLQQNPRDEDSLLSLAKICLSSDKFKEAEIFFDAVLSVNAGHKEARTGRQICRIQEEYDRLYEHCLANHASTDLASFTETFRKDGWKFYLRLNQIELLNFQNKAIVDFGCKYGHSVPFLVCSGARHITGIDGYDEYLKAGASVFERLYANVKMMASNEGFIPIQSETVDLVLMIEVISHINPSYLDTVFSEVLRIMKRGGVLFIADGNNLANQGCRKALVPLYEAWENGPNGTKTDRDVVEVSFLTRRKNIIRNLYPQISTDKLDDLALNTSGLFGSYLEKTIDEFVQTGKLIRRPYLTGICPTNPIGYGTVMERGFYPQQVAMNLSQHGIEPHHVLIRAFDFFSDYASKLSVNDVAICQSDLGRSTGFHIIGIKK